MARRIQYKPIKGWFDLSKLNLPDGKFNAYVKLQQLGQAYQDTYAYQKKYNSAQFERVKELCSKMQMDLILNYGALEKEGG